VKTIAATVTVLSILAVCWLSEAKNAIGSMNAQAQSARTNSKNEIERGKYLVEEVAKCTECHTPRDDRGELKKEAWLQGAPIWITPVHPDSNWADRAPALAGLPSFTQEEAERVLEKGIGPQGEALRPPMHIYHMKPEDAKAIIAYLNSLPRGTQQSTAKIHGKLRDEEENARTLQ
jgi:mono/diheme cytochrome c family protein